MATQKALPSDPAYLKAAFSKLGLSEIEGARHEKQILAMYAASGHPEIHDDETPWCAAFIGWCLEEGGLVGTHSLMARSYATYGKALNKKDTIPRGAIAVWTRDGGGHVNFVLDDDGVYVTCIGGNQSNDRGGGVTISRRRKSDAVAFRMPLGVVVPLPKPKVKPKPPADTAVVTVDAPPAKKAEEIEKSIEKDEETSGSWLKRKWKSVAGWSSGFSITSLFGWFTEPKVFIALLVFLLVVGLIVLAVLGPSWARPWLRKQVS